MNFFPLSNTGGLGYDFAAFHGLSPSTPLPSTYRVGCEMMHIKKRYQQKQAQLKALSNRLSKYNNLTTISTTIKEEEKQDSLIHSLLGISNVGGMGGLGKLFANTYLNNQDKGRLSQTCHSLYGSFHHELTAKKLLHHVVRGEQAQAKVMIAKKPTLLLLTSKAQDYSGRIIKGTAFQAALGAEDHRMYQMMVPFFKRLENESKIPCATTTMEKQFDAQFPKGIESISASELKPFYDNLAKAIINNDDSGLGAIERFRKEITQQNTISSGKHFNMQHIVAAYQSYADNYLSLATKDNRETFFIKVLGFLQRQMPTCYAQAMCSGILCSSANPLLFERTFAIFDCGNFFPLSENPGLGFNYNFAPTRPPLCQYSSSAEKAQFKLTCDENALYLMKLKDSLKQNSTNGYCLSNSAVYTGDPS